MIFNTYIGNVSVFLNKIRVVVRKPIENKEQYDTTMKAIFEYLVLEGFFLTTIAAENMTVHNSQSVNLKGIKNILSENAREWFIDLYDNYGHRIDRENVQHE